EARSPLTSSNRVHHRGQIDQHLIAQPSRPLDPNTVGPARRQQHPAEGTAMTAEDETGSHAPFEQHLELLIEQRMERMSDDYIFRTFVRLERLRAIRAPSAHRVSGLLSHGPSVSPPTAPAPACSFPRTSGSTACR